MSLNWNAGSMIAIMPSLFLLLGLFLFGCVIGTQNPAGPADLGRELQGELNDSAGNLSAQQQADLITVSGDEMVSVVKITATRASGKWRFPRQNYPGEFTSIGLYSDTFVRLNNSQVMMLDENEAIWLTPLIRVNDSQPVLFNAIYSNDIASCGASSVRILGKEYRISQLRDGASFGNDDKWKVALDYQNDGSGSCLKRVIIYLDGYFYEMKEGDQIPLFRNDNTILAKFTNLKSEPTLEIIGTKQSSVPATSSPASATNSTNRYTIYDTFGNSYNETVKVGVGGMQIYFEPGLQMFISDAADDLSYQFYNLIENQYINIAGTKWDIIRLRANGTRIGTEEPTYKNGSYTPHFVYVTRDELILAKRPNHDTDNKFWRSKCDNLTIGNKTYIVHIGVGKVLLDQDFQNCSGPVDWNGDIPTDNRGYLFTGVQSIQKIDGHWVWMSFISSIDAGLTVFSTYPEIMNLTDESQVSLVWEPKQDDVIELTCTAISCISHSEETFSNPRLKSIFVPRSSPIFEKLTN